MKIRAVRVHHISAPLVRTYWMSLEPYSTSAELIVEIETSDGVVGTGQAHGRPLTQIATILVEKLAPVLLHADPLAHETLWDQMFSMTHTRAGGDPASGDGQPHFGAGLTAQFMAAMAGLDIALWDLKGKILGVPMYRLLGGASPTVDCYASGGYYRGSDEIAQLVEEASGYVADGFRALKVKVGGMSIDEDLARLAAVRDEFPAVDLMVDANSAYSVSDAIAAAHAFEPVGIRWYEEPTHWYDPVEGLGQVSRSTTIPTASGESALHRWACRDLTDRAGIRYMQFDATRSGGITEWLRVAAYAGHHSILMAPHHDPQIHAHLVAAVANGSTVEFFPDHERDPLWREIYEEQPKIALGKCHLSESPGLGYSFNWEAVARRRLGPVQQVAA